eukprot:TRINITY_DN1487_c0_g1_i1.p2 TRINITY_DN1487_c0_g1~~TRINITY_DN1487_c0_g1_i1.p2  ORF type:complete len:444 (-),score=39.47 TRINITY_DN1487_c0_g1_i1:11798-13129(-)
MRHQRLTCFQQLILLRQSQVMLCWTRQRIAYVGLSHSQQEQMLQNLRGSSLVVWPNLFFRNINKEHIKKANMGYVGELKGKLAKKMLVEERSLLSEYMPLITLMIVKKFEQGAKAGGKLLKHFGISFEMIETYLNEVSIKGQKIKKQLERIKKLLSIEPLQFNNKKSKPKPKTQFNNNIEKRNYVQTTLTLPTASKPQVKPTNVPAVITNAQVDTKPEEIEDSSSEKDEPLKKDIKKLSEQNINNKNVEKKVIDEFVREGANKCFSLENFNKVIGNVGTSNKITFREENTREQKMVKIDDKDGTTAISIRKDIIECGKRKEMEGKVVSIEENSGQTFITIAKTVLDKKVIGESKVAFTGNKAQKKEGHKIKRKKSNKEKDKKKKTKKRGKYNQLQRGRLRITTQTVVCDIYIDSINSLHYDHIQLYIQQVRQYKQALKCQRLH